MDIEKLKKDYKKYEKCYSDFQKDAFTLLHKIKSEREDTIDILDVNARPRQEIKKLNKIIHNIKENGKYKTAESILDIRDVAGVRITCYCESDKENLADILEGELRRIYKKVERSAKKGPYFATHFDIFQEVYLEGGKQGIWCEIQVRTVMGNAWAIQDHKYVYSSTKEGESQTITKAISDVMNGLEGLWDMLKNKNNAVNQEIDSSIPEKTKAITEQVRKVITEVKEDANKWWSNIHKTALAKFKESEASSYMEISLTSEGNQTVFDNSKLLIAADESQIRTFGWPIGIMHRGNEQYGPKPISGGIIMSPDEGNEYFTFWALRNDGSFYQLKSLFEDQRGENKIFFNTRISRITETLLYAANLYKKLGFDGSAKIKICIKHGGLKGRTLTSTGSRHLSRRRPAEEDSISTTIETSLEDIETNLTDNVELFTKPLFELFDFFELDRGVLDDIVTNYRNGKIT